MREFEHQVKHPVSRAAIQVAGGFIGEHTGRLSDQRPGHRNPLAFAAREFARAVLQTVLQPNTRQHGSSSSSSLWSGHATDPQRHGHVVKRAKFGQQVVELVHKTQVLVAQSPLLLCTLNPESVAQQLDLTGTGCIQAAKQVQERALARPRRPHNRQRLATVHLQVHLLQH